MNIFKGTGVALVTPFKTDYSVDYKALRKLVRLQIHGGADFLVVMGTTGEAPTLSAGEKAKVLDVVQEENAGRLAVVYGVGGNDTLRTAETLRELTEFSRFPPMTTNPARRAFTSITNTWRNPPLCRSFSTMSREERDPT